jgi:hypothetical protein
VEDPNSLSADIYQDRGTHLIGLAIGQIGYPFSILLHKYLNVQFRYYFKVWPEALAQPAETG